MTTALQIAEKAIQLADQNPHFVYRAPRGEDNPNRDCLYVHEGKGSCIFGQALMDLGVVDADYLEEHKDARIGVLIRMLEDARYLTRGAHVGLIARMGTAQRLQDDGTEWADAVASLREYVGKVTAA